MHAAETSACHRPGAAGVSGDGHRAWGRGRIHCQIRGRYERQDGDPVLDRGCLDAVCPVYQSVSKTAKCGRELASSRREQNGADGPAADDGKEAGLDLLLKYDIVIVDEAHERTLNTDFICGALKKIQRVRKQLSQANREQERDGESSSSTTKTRDARPLKIVVMSATLDPSKFTRFFETSVLHLSLEALLMYGAAVATR